MVTMPAVLVAATSAAAAPVRVAIQGPTKTISTDRNVITDQGTVTGSPIGSGKITMVFRLNPLKSIARSNFTIVNAKGTITGRVLTRYTASNVTIKFAGVARFTGGTGAYRGITSAPMQYYDIHSLTGQKGKIAFLGTAQVGGRR